MEPKSFNIGTDSEAALAAAGLPATARRNCALALSCAERGAGMYQTSVCSLFHIMCVCMFILHIIYVCIFVLIEP